MVFAPEAAGGMCLGSAMEDRGQWIVFKGDAFKKSQVAIVGTASEARDLLEQTWGSLIEVGE